ncbi:MAG: hypothetical protein ABW007_07495 [Chitinophagaceae bacterium]
MNAIILISFLLLNIQEHSKNNHRFSSMAGIEMIKEKDPAPELSISFPKNNQKVRGVYKIYGKAKPGAKVVLQVSSSYFKTTQDGRNRVAKGDGPLARMNRKFSLTADRNGTWILKEIELLNAGWEETFTIKATVDNKSVTIRVYDNTHPVMMD